MTALPFDIINKIKSFIPRDKIFKSPTSELIKREFNENDNYYDTDRHDKPFNSFAAYWFHLYYVTPFIFKYIELTLEELYKYHFIYNNEFLTK